MPDTTTLDLVDMIFKIARGMRGQMSFTSDLTHLSVLQIQALVFLSQHDQAAMTEIAEYFQIELPSATSLISKLIKKKLVVRVPGVSDRRQVHIVLSPKGQSSIQEIFSHRQQKIEKLLSYISDKDKQDLFRILETIHNQLEAQK